MIRMPDPKTNTEAVERLVLVLAALTADWQSQDDLIERIGIYPEARSSAMRMLPRDMRALMALGFEIERSDGHHDPAWRLNGHARFGKAVPSKFCSRCQQWRPLDDFQRNASRGSGKQSYCRFCNADLAAARYADHPGESPSHKAWRLKFPERGRAAMRRYAAKRRKRNESGDNESYDHE